MLTWVVFSGLLDPLHLGLGILSSLAVTGLSWKLLWQRPDMGLAQRLGQWWGIIRYSFWLLGQIVLANLNILKLAFAPNTEVDPIIVHRAIHLQSDFARYLLAQSITLTPGTVTVKVDDDELVVHAINREAAESLNGSMERRIAAILEPTVYAELGGAR